MCNPHCLKCMLHSRHIKGGGGIHRRTIGDTSQIVIFIVEINFPWYTLFGAIPITNQNKLKLYL